METHSPIVLLTDFGTRDAFAGILKGVILSIHPEARILDLSHGVGPQDILHAAFLLSASVRFFPGDTIFCVVVDPGVGTGRRPILVRAGNYWFVGPDNGVMYPAARENGIRSVIHLTREAYFLPRISATFHGRDIFAPVAAHLSSGVPGENFGPPLEAMVPFEIPCPGRQGKAMVLTVIHVDAFGNLTLNLTGEEFQAVSFAGFVLEIPRARGGISAVREACFTYAQGPDNIPFVLESSTGHMEIAVKNGSAAQVLGLKRMDRVLLRSNE